MDSPNSNKTAKEIADEMIAAAIEKERREAAERPFEVRLYRHDDYVFDRVQEKFWDLKTNQLVSALVVDNSIPRDAWTQPEMREGQRGRPPAPIRPSVEIMDVDQQLTVHSSTWWPNKPNIIHNVIADAAGISKETGVMMYNAYRGPKFDVIRTDAEPWVEHVMSLWPNKVEHEFFFNYAAHMIQKPEEKCNAGIILSGSQGTGKDAALMPLKEAVGFANAQNISPDSLFSEFNDFAACVMLVVDEARSQSDEHKATAMYNVLKPYCAAPPMMIRVNEKRLKAKYVMNCVRIYVTTNEVEGLYVPKDDRRLFILHTELGRKEVLPNMDKYWNWIRNGGSSAVYGWLKARDISKFDASKEPPKTAKHTELSHSWGIDPDSCLGKVLDGLQAKNDGKMPPVLFYDDLRAEIEEHDINDTREAMKLLGPRSINRTMQRAGYVTMGNPETPTGEWRLNEMVDGKNYQVKFATAYRLPEVSLAEARMFAEKILRNKLKAIVRKGSIKGVPTEIGKF